MYSSKKQFWQNCQFVKLIEGVISCLIIHIHNNLIGIEALSKIVNSYSIYREDKITVYFFKKLLILMRINICIKKMITLFIYFIHFYSMRCIVK